MKLTVLGAAALLILLAGTGEIPSVTAANGKVFREYIGALWNAVTLSDVPVNTADEVHFILAFAIDYDSSTSTFTNGVFSAFWDTNTITPDAISAIKSQYNNVKVMLSLGGDTVSGNSVQFQPTSVDSWVSNAVSSLTTLIQDYNLDGIDVDYEHFDDTTDADFASAIGQLITQLKSNGVISSASIAPFPSVQAPYTALWSSYASVIDYVNFQFYSYDSSTTADQFVSYYNDAVSTYSGGTVLASFSTASGTGATPDVALSACQTLQNSGSLPGIFIWCADNSYANGSFDYETKAQTLLASS